MKKQKKLVLTFVILLAFGLLNGQAVKVNAATVSTMTGIDVYSGTNVTDWSAVKKAGVSSVYIKLTDGLTYNNPKALAQYNGAKSVGIKVGAYHFAEDNNVDSEYNHFKSEADKYQWDLKPVLDYEVGGNTDFNFISKFMAKDPNLIYYGSHSIADATGLPINRIWVAEPSDAGGYTFTGTTKGYAGIQYLWHGIIDGLEGDADVDLFSNDILLIPHLPALLCVDTPLNNSTIPKSVSVVGWTLNGSGNKQVDILVDGNENGIATIGKARADVAGIYPSYNNPNSGFSYNLDISNLSYGKHIITVKSTGTDGTTSTQNINVVKSDQALLCVDAPLNDSTIPKSVSIAGWSLNTSGNKQVDILVDGNQTAVATIGLLRTDVAASYPSYNNSNSGFSYNLDASSLSYGKHIITVKSTGTDGNTCTKNINVVKSSTANSSSSLGVTYRSHVQSFGWLPFVNSGEESGTDGKGLRLEAFNISLVNAPVGAGIQYCAHVQSLGWMNEVSNGAEAGTNGKGLRLEALKISLVNMPGYSVQYRAHVQTIAWTPWVSDGAIAGTTGQSLRVEAIEVRIVDKATGTSTVSTVTVPAENISK